MAWTAVNRVPSRPAAAWTSTGVRPYASVQSSFSAGCSLTWACSGASRSSAHRPILHEPDEIPSIEEASLSPTELPFTQEDFEQQLQDALELVPEVLGDESVGIKYAINGLLSLTPDGLPLKPGQSVDVRPLQARSGS